MRRRELIKAILASASALPVVALAQKSTMPVIGLIGAGSFGELSHLVPAFRQGMAEADQDWIRKQKLLDHLWQQKLDAEAPFDDGYVEIGGFRERRSTYGFHKSERDSDWRM